MGEITKKYQDELPRIKKNVENAFSYWKDNYDSYWEWSDFVYVTTINEDWKAYLQLTQTPCVEFNIVEPFINRQCGEFVKNEPAVYVSSEKPDQANVNLEQVIEGFFRHQFHEAMKSGIQRQTYANMLAKGFGVMKVWTDYKNNSTFDLDIFWDNAFDPTLCFFDPLAKKHHKNDGAFAGECYLFSEEEFKQTFPKSTTDGMNFTKATTDGMNFTTNVGSFNWCFSQLDKKIVLVCDYFERSKKRTKIVKIATGDVMTYENYNKVVSDIETYGLPIATPEIVDERYVLKDTVVKYRITDKEVLSYEETNYTSLPYVWFIGSSTKTKNSGTIKEVCRPLIYNAKGAQQLKNISGQSLISAIQNQPRKQWAVPVEGIPAGQEDMYKDDNVPGVVLYNVFSKTNPEKPLPAPQLIQPTMINQEFANSFQIADRSAQASMGIYDAALGINDNQLSGAAIDAGAMQSNAAVVPFNTSYMDSLNQVANIMLELMPKIWTDKRTVQVKTNNGKTASVPINNKGIEGSPDFTKLDPENINIKIEAGANFALQKNKSLKSMAELSQAFPIFSAFLQQTPEALKVIADNLEISGKDMLLKLIDGFVEQQKVAMEKAKQNPQPSPDMMMMQLKQQELQLKSKQSEDNLKLDAARIGVEQSKVDNDRILALSKIHETTTATELQHMKSHAEEARAEADVVIKFAELEHRREKDKLNHKVNVADTILKHSKE